MGGGAQDTAGGVAVAFGVMIREVFAALAGRDALGPALAGPATGYTAVYCIEIVLLVATVLVMAPLIGSKRDASFAESRSVN